MRFDCFTTSTPGVGSDVLIPVSYVCSMCVTNATLVLVVPLPVLQVWSMGRSCSTSPASPWRATGTTATTTPTSTWRDSCFSCGPTLPRMGKLPEAPAQHSPFALLAPSAMLLALALWLLRNVLYLLISLEEVRFSFAFSLTARYAELQQEYSARLTWQ